MKKHILTLSFVVLGSTVSITSFASAHEGHAHAENETRSNTKVEVNSSDDGSSVRLKIQNRLNSTNTIKDVKQQSIDDRKATFQEKLNLIKDEKKKALAERLSTQINKINDIRTERYLRNLERLSRILEKIEDRVNELEESGKSVADLKTTIASIESAIDSTTTKVEAQQEKVYTVQIQSESTLKTDFRQVHTQLKTDLSALQAEMKDIKDDMLSLVRELKAASSASPTPTASPTT